MKINRKKILEETSGMIDDTFGIMDSLCAALEYYINNDEVAGGHGCGCFTKPAAAVREFLESEDICEYVDFSS